MSERLVSAVREGRKEFLALVADLRPELHRYCARMTGSAADGEDVLQDALARAYYALAELEELPPLRPWLLRIVHNRALDHLRRYERRMSRPLDHDDDALPAPSGDPEDALAREEATRAALSRFLELVPLQRSCVILKDVLGHSAEEIADLLDSSVPAVKAALHRGRDRLRLLATTEPPARSISPGIERWVTLFNARDWEALRVMLAHDVRLDLASRAQRAGPNEVSSYFTNYDKVADWHFVPAWVDGREGIAVFRRPGDARAAYFIELTMRDGLVTLIRDFRYVAYIATDAEITVARAEAGSRSNA